MTEPKVRLAREMYASRQYTVAAIASALAILGDHDGVAGDPWTLLGL
jgi:hypothetical protein